ncbi:MAG: DUF1080 domain-containing protein [Planctomycetales bacterium]|nr:DUF1080 domain-containing protein [Planctomycetales bacterium]
MKSSVIPMHCWALYILAVALSTTAMADEKPVDKPLEPGFVALFDGKTLDGWEGNLGFFRIEQGAIVAGSLEKNIPNNEFLCTQKQYSDFELRLEVKLQGAGNNAGVQFRSARVPDDHEVSGYQGDVGVAWGRPVWGGLYDESRRNKMLAEGPADQLPGWVKEGDWNELWIRAVGDKIELFLNGHPTIQYIEQDAQIARSGIIGLQIHSGPPTEAWYRNIRIKVIGDQ